MRRFAIAVVGAAMCLAANSAEAVHPRRGPAVSVPSKQAAIGAYGRAVYPKYYRSFHSRDLQNIGVPHGDIGILGSGLQRDPW